MLWRQTQNKYARFLAYIGYMIYFCRKLTAMFKVDSIKNIKPLPNKVVIRLAGLNDHITLSSGQKLYLETKYEPANHTPVIGEVVAVPDRLYFNKTDFANSMEWETTMDLRVGDTVYLDYFAVHQCLGEKYDRAAAYEDPRWFELDDQLYIIPRYADVYFVKRGEDIIPINGYCIAQELVDREDSEIVPGFLRNKKSSKWAKLIYVGDPCTDFVDKRYSDGAKLKAGDIVAFSRWSNQRVEYGLHQTFMKGKDYAVIQRKYIRARLNSDIQKLAKKGSTVVEMI